CSPAEAGISTDVVRRLGAAIPILGVCLGHQCIGAAYGGEIVRAGQPMHGKTSMIHHGGAGIFRGLPTPFRATRYHSLVIAPASVPAELEVLATSEDGEIMAVRHVRHPVHGVQFHPESVLTEHGYRLVDHFLHGVPAESAMLLARASLASPQVPAIPTTVVKGAPLEAACSWRELEVVSIDDTPPRSRIETRVVHRGLRREFLGFNRAKHAVLEAAILATRTHLIPAEEIRAEYARLQVIVDKTAGPREREAMAMLTEYVRSR